MLMSDVVTHIGTGGLGAAIALIAREAQAFVRLKINGDRRKREDNELFSMMREHLSKQDDQAERQTQLLGDLNKGMAELLAIARMQQQSEITRAAVAAVALNSSSRIPSGGG